MITESIEDEFTLTHLGHRFFLGRQAILARDQKIVGYALLLRSPVPEQGNISGESGEDGIGLDLAKIFDGLPGVVRAGAATVMSDAIHSFNSKNLVLEISESDATVSGVADRIAALVSAGFNFALLHPKMVSQGLQKLPPGIELIKIDISDFGREQLLELCDFYKQANKKLIAEKVQTISQFKMCLECGFDNFQGYFFAQMPDSSGGQFTPSELSIIHLMGLINSDAENAEIESQIKRDVTIGLSLLRLVNTPAAGVPHKIESIHQALLILGRRQLQRWLQILLYTKSGRGGNGAPHTSLLVLASGRGKLLELIAEKLKPGNHGMADMGFAIGIMSLMDRLFGLSMGELLKQISVIDDVSDALLDRTGFFGEILRLVEYAEQFEESDFESMVQLLDKLHLSIENFNRLQLLAFEWADQIAQDVC